ncbi:MAG TPA: hypothetical protein VF458_09455 [Ktedonobacteraceae bacterium]
MNELSAHPVQDVPIVGVFRSQAQAENAVSALKDADFTESQIFVTGYEGARADDRRIIVHVIAAGREQAAVGLLVHHGANNSDLPPGTEMVGDNLVLRDPDAAPALSQQPTRVDPFAFSGETEAEEHRAR